jgi:hypothetical protein
MPINTKVEEVPVACLFIIRWLARASAIPQGSSASDLSACTLVYQLKCSNITTPVPLSTRTPSHHQYFPTPYLTSYNNGVEKGYAPERPKYVLPIQRYACCSLRGTSEYIVTCPNIPTVVPYAEPGKDKSDGDMTSTQPSHFHDYPRLRLTNIQAHSPARCPWPQ